VARARHLSTSPARRTLWFSRFFAFLWNEVGSPQFYGNPEHNPLWLTEIGGVSFFYYSRRFLLVGVYPRPPKKVELGSPIPCAPYVRETPPHVLGDLPNDSLFLRRVISPQCKPSSKFCSPPTGGASLGRSQILFSLVFRRGRKPFAGLLP